MSDNAASETGMSKSDAIQVLCRYLVKPGHSEEFAAILKRHWQTLRGAGLTTADPAKVLRGSDKAGNVAFIESFSWRDEDAVSSAHESPDVMKLWEPMGALCENMEFWHVEESPG